MSLAMFAASFDDNATITMPNMDNNTDNIINQKRHKRTQRKYPKMENFDTHKVSSVLKEIHNSSETDDDDNDRFNPPPNPESMGAMKTTPSKESFVTPLGRTIGKAPTPADDTHDLDLNDYGNYGDSKTNEEYYKALLPSYAPKPTTTHRVNRPYYPADSNYAGEPDVLTQKLNYVISLLEDQQDVKTNNVTEEVILYSFLGIFIIFMADTFVRAGKYAR